MGLRRWLLPLAFVLGTSTVAYAAPSAKDRTDAAALTIKSRNAARAKNLDEAIGLLRQADGLDPTVARKLELAKLLVEAKKLIEASKILNGLVNDSTLGPGDKWAKDAAKKQLATFEARIPWLAVHVIGPTKGVHIEIDGKEVEVDVESPVDPGQRAVSADAEGFDSADTSINVPEGEHKQVTLTLIASAPGKPVVEKQETTGGTKWPAIVSFVVGAAGIGVGTAFGVFAFDEANKAKSYCKDNVCPNLPEVVDARNVSIANGNVSTVGFVIGGVGVAAGVILALTVGRGTPEKPKDKKEAFHVQPYVGVGSAGLVGTF